MTEEDWLACADPEPMLAFLRGRASDRKLRLFACDCVRRLWAAVEDGSIPREVFLSERSADGEAGPGERIAARKLLGGRGGYSSAWAANQSLGAVLEPEAWTCADRARRAAGDYRWYLAQESGGNGIESETEGIRQLERLRDLFGNPFRPVTLDPAWQTSAALALARRMYDTRDFTPMPVLADALMDAGCDHADLLAHLRGDGPHARGCWALDLLLGKE